MQELRHVVCELGKSEWFSLMPHIPIQRHTYIRLRVCAAHSCLFSKSQRVQGKATKLTDPESSVDEDTCWVDWWSDIEQCELTFFELATVK